MIDFRFLADKSLVAIDLAACVVVDPRGLQRCLDTVFSATASDETCWTPLLHRVYGALDRVLIAHITCDPFVSPTAGANELMRCLRRRGSLVLAVATFSPGVMRAALRRFGWEDVLVVDPFPSIAGSKVRSHLGNHRPK